jgi:glucose-6-phosphate 1-dehydrogenase
MTAFVEASSGNHLFYVSTPASVAGPVIAGLGAAGLNHNPDGWSRIVVEKPFGRDLRSAREPSATARDNGHGTADRQGP